MRVLALGLAALWSLYPGAVPEHVRQPIQQRPAFRGGTRLIEVSVVVYDKHRKPVNGLMVEDFRLYDAGREQKIEFFSIESDRIAASAADAGLAKPGEFSNRLEGVGGGVTVILFDRLNTSWGDQVYARNALLKFLEQIDGTDRIGLYLLDGDAIRVLHDFTSDARSLVRALARFRAVTSNELSAVESAALVTETGDARLDAEIDSFLGRGASRMAEHFNGLRAQSTIAALESAANRLAGIRGRKNLIWVSSGFPSPETWDGRYHQIRVQVHGPGVEARHRRGYLASATGAQNDAQRSASLLAAAQSPIEATGIELKARLERVEETGSDVTVTVRVGPGAITLEKLKEHWEGAAEIVIAQILPDGSVRSSVDKKVDVRMTVERYEQMLAEGLSMDATITVLPDAQRLHIIVRDVATGGIGSVIIPGVKIRAIRDP